MVSTRNQRLDPRKPRQERSRQKVELILEAAIRLLEKGGIAALTTNAIAATAGVSIGTIYQYFRDKEAILDALADVETEAMAERVTAAMENPDITTPQARVTAVVSAVAATYGNRHQAHRLVMAHSLSRGSNRLSPLLSQLRACLSTRRATGALTAPLDAADAFVLIHAFAGVLRAMSSEGEAAPSSEELERGLTRLVLSFFT